MNGYYVNTGLFYAVPRFLGLIEKGCWNPEKNSIYVAFSQDKVLREEIAKTDIVIQGEKNDVMYILETEDRKTGLTDGRMSSGRNLVVRGAYIKVVGDDPSVGISFRNKADDTVVKVEEEMYSTNNPSELIFIVPTELKTGIEKRVIWFIGLYLIKSTTKRQ